MALGGKGVSLGRGAGLVGSDTGLSSGIGGLQGIDAEDGLHCNFVSNVYYRKVAGSPAIFSALTTMFAVTCDALSMYVNRSGYMVQSATNSPRIEYRANGTCLGILREPSRINVCLQSADFATSSTLTNIRAFGSGSTVNAVASPSNAVDADLITEDNTNGVHRISATAIAGLVAATTYSASVYMKAGTRTRARVSFCDSTFTDGAYVEANLSAGTVTGSGALGAGTLTATGIELMPNGFYRVWVVGAMNNARTSGTIAVNILNAAGTLSYAGDNASGLYVWGRQIEAGDTPSSYIPTTTVSVTRANDRYIRTLSTEFNNALGTFSVHHNMASTVGATPCIFSVHNNTVTGAEEMLMYGNAAARRWFITDASVSQANVLGTNVADYLYSRCASVFQVNDFHLSVDGTLAVSPDTSGTLPTVTHLDLLRQDASAITLGHITKLDYWPERVNDTILKGI